MYPQHHRRQTFSTPSYTDSASRRRVLDDTLGEMFAHGLPYSRKLSAHSSCINALAFSSQGGRFLASGGDDLRILLWDFHQDDVEIPSHSFNGPMGNIFTLAFSASDRYLYSGGVDETICKYDVSQLGIAPLIAGSIPPDLRFRHHTDSIRGISCHPTQDDIFLSASEDGRIIMHDGRANNFLTRSQGTLQVGAEATGVQFHPLMENVFATSDSRGRVCLRDTRMAFGGRSRRTHDGVVLQYTTKLAKPSVAYLSNPESSSITFDREGNKLAVTMLHFLPTIYSLSDPHPLATCSGRNLPSGLPVPPGHRSYSNSCTMKHGSFGGPGLSTDEYYCAGSDDFCAYLWKIPKLSELADRRQEVSADAWPACEPQDTIGFTEGPLDIRYIPVDLNPLCRMTGHQSIVNTTLVHPHLFHVVTSGIERDIVVHSPTPSSPCFKDMAVTPTEVRSLPDSSAEDRLRYYRALMGPALAVFSNVEDEEPEIGTISMFDHILREEGGADIFAVREWAEPETSSDSENDSDEDDEMQDE